MGRSLTSLPYPFKKTPVAELEVYIEIQLNGEGKQPTQARDIYWQYKLAITTFLEVKFTQDSTYWVQPRPKPEGNYIDDMRVPDAVGMLHKLTREHVRW